MSGLFAGYAAVLSLVFFASLAAGLMAGVTAMLAATLYYVAKKVSQGVGRLIVPSQKRVKKEIIPGEFFVQALNSKSDLLASPFYANLSTLEVKPESGIDSGRYIICFCDKDRLYSHKTKREDAQALANQNQATVVLFNYPNVGNSTGSVYSQKDLIEAGRAQVNRLLNKGVSASKITLYGHSLGGAIATLVAAKCHSHHNRVFLVNDRSFSTIGDTLAGWVKGPIWLKKGLKVITNPLCRLFNWNLDAAKAYKRIPDKYKMHIVSKKDRVISYQTASLHKKNRSVLNAYKGYTYKVGGEHNAHNKPLHVLVDNKTPAVSMNTHISRFIARA